jgi:hypothetical protein
MYARPMIQVRDEESKSNHWREFDVMRTFASETEAREYAKENGVRVIEESEKG